MPTSKTLSEKCLNRLRERLEEEQDMDSEKRDVSWRMTADGRAVVLSNDIEPKVKLSILDTLDYKRIVENFEAERTEEEIVERRRWAIYRIREHTKDCFILGSKSLYEDFRSGDGE